MDKNTLVTDAQIDQLHREACAQIAKLKPVLDELKKRGPHSRDSWNAIDNVEFQLRNLAERAQRPQRR